MTFEPSFLRTVVDVLLPGLAAEGNKPAIPSASSLDIHLQLAEHLKTHPDRVELAKALQFIIDFAGGADALGQMDEIGAAVAVGSVEHKENALFMILLNLVSADYYEHPVVLTAFGWRPTPPQPEGYTLLPMDESLLEQVKASPPIWRPASGK